MPPNARPRDDDFFLEEEEPTLISDSEITITERPTRPAYTKGLMSLTSGEDWTDVTHSERKKRDRILEDGVLLGLLKKSDYEGWKRLTINLTIMAATVLAVGRCRVDTSTSSVADWLVFLPLYFFYGFQFQCFAFAGQHEFLHRNAFKTKWINDVCLFLVSVFCFENGAHEQVMHKQHHTYTNNIDRVRCHSWL
jgi:Fatty acid desaturase